jgi:hypothetical protein
MRRAIDSAGLTPADLDAVLLVGGSSRIPLVAQQVGAELDLPVTVDSDPKAVVAIGAALSVAPGKEIVPATRKPLALLPAGFSGEEQTPAPRRRRVVYALVGVSAFAAAMIGLAGIVGTDVRPLGEMAADDGIAAPAIGVEGADGTTVPKDAVDPWTGKPYTETTKPGPTRPDAKPTKASPAKLAPKPTKAKNRDALVDGAPPPPPPNTGGDDGGSDPGTTDPGTPSDSPPASDPPPDNPPASDPPPDNPPASDPPSDNPPASDPPPDNPPASDPPPDNPPPSDPPANQDPPPADPPSGEPPPSEGA